ncbi:MAG: ribosomal RNA small subunit methyltransferase A [Chloroflexi bacterium]|nr:ribosomal RNA small subunit methyltransferase A [Chloroflexota bacterium]
MRARKRFAQHFLEPAWVRKVVSAVAPAPTDHMVEIGPGRAALTLPLAACVQRLLAIEVDRDLAQRLEARGLPNVTVITADFLALDVEAAITAWLGVPLDHDHTVRIVGNLPYNISSPILFRLLELSTSTRGLHDAVLMLQKEVADRLVAKVGTGEYGVLTVLTALRADVTRLLSLPPGAFRPAPKVSSAVVRLDFRPSPAPIEDEALFTRMVRTIFTQRRKTLRNALEPFAATLAIPAEQALLTAGIEARRRPETLQLVEMARLADVFAASRASPVL